MEVRREEEKGEAVLDLDGPAPWTALRFTPRQLSSWNCYPYGIGFPKVTQRLAFSLHSGLPSLKNCPSRKNAKMIISFNLYLIFPTSKLVGFHFRFRHF